MVSSRAGYVKFDSSVSAEQVQVICDEWKRAFFRSRWLDVHVRSGGHSTWDLGFHVVIDDGSKATSEIFDDMLLNDLRRRFGVDARNHPLGVKHWSLGTVL